MKNKPAVKFRTDLRETLVELVEASVHHILATRAIYPKSIFAKRLFGPIHLGMPVMVSEHPEINSFITEGLTGLKDTLFNPNSSHLINRFDLVILENTEDGREIILETYIFQFEFLIDDCKEENFLLKQTDCTELKQNLQAIFLSLNSRLAELGPIQSETKYTLEPDYLFNFRLHTSHQVAQELAKELIWCKIPSTSNYLDHSRRSSPGTIDLEDGASGFSICDMVKQKSEELLKSKNPNKNKSSKAQRNKNPHSKAVLKLLQEPSEKDKELLDINEKTNLYVITPVYQFNVPLKFQLLIEHIET